MPQTVRWNWTNIGFMLVTTVLGTVGTALYTYRNGFAWWMLALTIVLYAVSGVGIGAYHRLFSHRAYTATRAVKAAFLVCGATAWQNSALLWSAMHRIHHRYTDTDKDPYSVTRGFWWAHIGWILVNDDTYTAETAPRDLRDDPLVAWQHRWYIPLATIFGFGIPILVGYLFGDVLAGLFWGGFTRIVLIHHSTFCVNSVAHLVGTRPYSLKESARDNAFVAFIALGEGFHNFHHTFMADWRNGIRLYHFDPNKWLIATLAYLRLAKVTHTTPPERIEAKRLEVAWALAQQKLTDASAFAFTPAYRHLRRADRLLRRAWRSAPRTRSWLVRCARREERRALAA